MTAVLRRTQLLRCELLTQYSGRSDELRAALSGPTGTEVTRRRSVDQVLGT